MRRTDAPDLVEMVDRPRYGRVVGLPHVCPARFSNNILTTCPEESPAVVSGGRSGANNIGHRFFRRAGAGPRL
jgi:hypothetical protein